MSALPPVYYFISGLGADATAFSRLSFRKEVDYVDCDWIKPNTDESIQSYAVRLFERYHIPGRPAHLVGLSFGGMVASELSGYPGVKSVTLISSSADHKDFPLFLRACRYLPIEKLITSRSLKAAAQYAPYAFGPVPDKDKLILKMWLDDADADFYRWAVGAIRKWRKPNSSNEIFRIHGASDRMLPAQGIVDISVPGAGHFGVYTHAQIFDAHLRKHLQLPALNKQEPS